MILFRRVGRHRIGAAEDATCRRDRRPLRREPPKRGAPPPRATSTSESVSQNDREVVNRLEFARREYEQPSAPLSKHLLLSRSRCAGEMEDLVTYIYGELEATNSDTRRSEPNGRRRKSAPPPRAGGARTYEFLATSTTTTTRPVPTTTRPVRRRPTIQADDPPRHDHHDAR